MEPESTSEISRRTALKKISFFACAIPVSITVITESSEAQGKTPKAQADYQDKPSGNQQCSGCVNFNPPKGCKILEGDISPQGWCKFWKAKG